MVLLRNDHGAGADAILSDDGGKSGGRGQHLPGERVVQRQLGGDGDGEAEQRLPVFGFQRGSERDHESAELDDYGHCDGDGEFHGGDRDSDLADQPVVERDGRGEFHDEISPDRDSGHRR